MKQTDYILKIDKPCEENWNAMTKTDGGKFCTHCSKTVIDFTSLSDEQIIRIIESNEGKLCGRLSNEQINRVMITRQPAAHTQLFKILTGLLLLGNTEKANASNIAASNNNIFFPTKSSTLQETTKSHPKQADTSINTITGSVLNEKTSEPIAYASVKIKGTNIGVPTDSYGNFKLDIPENLLTNPIHLMIMSVGYIQSETIITKNELPLNKTFLIKEDEISVTVGAVVVVTKKKKKWWQFWKKRKMHDHKIPLMKSHN